jgi:predicted DNA-binding protein
MITLTLKLSKEAEKELEKDLKHLETVTKKPRDFHIKEALIRYLENMEDIRDVEKWIKKKNKVYYTSEELSKRLNLD